jgi:hypothetical protein
MKEWREIIDNRHWRGTTRKITSTKVVPKEERKWCVEVGNDGNYRYATAEGQPEEEISH